MEVKKEAAPDKAEQILQDNEIIGNGGIITTLQSKIDSAVAGGIVDFDGGIYKTNNYITISKALTVDGKGIQGLTVKISSNVVGNVTLKNFKTTNVQVVDVPAVNRSIFSESTNNLSFKKYSDDALPLIIEGCTIEKFESNTNVALYLENGNKKSEIEEITLKEGTEGFTFVEFDKEETIFEEKSKVEKLFIEGADVEKINLIGGTFNDVDFADNFSGKIDFNYDKEFADDQLKFSDKDAFFADSKINEKDIGVAKKMGNNNVYKFEMPINDFNQYNGHIAIVFLTDSHISSIRNAKTKVDFIQLGQLMLPFQVEILL